MIIEIALGIVLAVVILAYFPLIIAGAVVTLGFGILIAVVGIVVIFAMGNPAEAAATATFVSFGGAAWWALAKFYNQAKTKYPAAIASLNGELPYDGLLIAIERGLVKLVVATIIATGVIAGVMGLVVLSAKIYSYVSGTPYDSPLQ